MAKSIDENFIDWEASAFGFGYGTGEPHVIPALKAFLELCPEGGTYDYQVMEAALGAPVAWLLINALLRHRVDALEYGTSPRYGWLTPGGRALRQFCSGKTSDELIDLATGYGEDYHHCYPDACNCGPDGHDPKRVCRNPFWGRS